jgi:hypothetical protein
MLRKTIMTLLSVAAVSLLSPTLASAQAGGFDGLGGLHGFHGGPGLAFGPHGLGIYADYPYGAYGYHYGYYNYPYHYASIGFYDDDGGCYLVRRRVHTRHGSRLWPVEQCD